MYQRIKDLREDKDLLQSDIAKILHITQQQYSNIESGRSEIRADQLIILSIFYNKTTDYILGLTNDINK